METLTARPERLEREGRRWRRIALAAGGLLSAVVLGGAARDQDGIAERVRTRRLFLHDTAGKRRAVLALDEDGPTLRVFEVGEPEGWILDGKTVVSLLRDKGAYYRESLALGRLVMEAVHGKVKAVDLGSKRVALDVGSRHKVEVGYTFDIHRGSQYIGQVNVDKVGPDWSSGTIALTAPGKTIQVGDGASTRL